MGDPPPPPPLNNHKIIGFLSNSAPEPLKNYKATEPALKVGPSPACQRNWLTDDGPFIVLFGAPAPHQLKKNVVKVGPPLTKFSGLAHGLCVW